MKSRFENLSLTAALASLPVASLAGCGINADSTATAAPATTVGTDIDDSVVTSSVKAALLAEPDVKSFDL